MKAAGFWSLGKILAKAPLTEYLHVPGVALGTFTETFSSQVFVVGLTISTSWARKGIEI